MRLWPGPVYITRSDRVCCCFKADQGVWGATEKSVLPWNGSEGRKEGESRERRERGAAVAAGYLEKENNMAAVELEWIPETLYNTAISAVVDNYSRSRRDIRSLPENIQFDVYYKVNRRPLTCRTRTGWWLASSLSEKAWVSVFPWLEMLANLKLARLEVINNK